jgi:hypothetical protein
MNRFIVKFFLSLCILLAGGYSQLYAYAYQDCVCFSPIKVPKKSEETNFCPIQNRPVAFVIQSAASGKEKATYVIDIAEKEAEEYESASSKKYLEISSYFTTRFDAQAAENLFGDLKSSPFGKHFSYISSYRCYLVLQVFRI